MSSAPAAFPRRGAPDEYFPAFDWLRIALAVQVVAAHNGILNFEGDASIPVQIFFSLSGWLIGGILCRSVPADLPRFYFNRFARIWIPYLVAVGLLIAVALLKDRVTAKWIEFLFYKLTFVFNLFGSPQYEHYAQAPLQGAGSHFWSICAEEQFYLLAPLLIVVLPFGRSFLLWTTISAAALWFPVARDYAAISLGVLAALSKLRHGDWYRTKIGAATIVLVLAGLTAAVVTRRLPQSIAVPFIGTAIVLLLARPGAGSRVSRFVGGISYPLYLNQWIGMRGVILACNKLGWRTGFGAQLLMVAIDVGIASLLYLTVDAPVRRERDRFFTSGRGLAVAATGAVLVLVGIAGGILYRRNPPTATSSSRTSAVRVAGFDDLSEGITTAVSTRPTKKLGAEGNLDAEFD